MKAFYTFQYSICSAFVRGIVLMLIYYMSAVNVFAQVPDFAWAKQAQGEDPGSNSEHGSAIAHDTLGNIYATGYFDGSIIFGSDTLTSKGASDIYIAKYDSLGNVLWASSGGGTSYDFASGISVDFSGNSYITGSFQGSTTFGNTTLTGIGNTDVLIVKYDASGNVVWARKAGGTGEDYVTGISADGSGNSFVTGYFYSSITFGGTTLTTNGNSDVFIGKYDASGNVVWAVNSGGSNFEISNKIGIDNSGNCYITGYFYGNAIFGSTTLFNNGSGTADVFIAKYNTSGNVVWAKNAGGSGYDFALGIAVDGSGNSYLTGDFEGSAAFGSDTLTSSGDIDVFVAKYDNSGVVLWARKAGGTGNDIGYSITADANGNSYVTGHFTGNASFGIIPLTSSGFWDIFIAKYDASGNVLWAKKVGGSSGDEDSYGITVDGNGNSYITGEFGSNAVFGSITLTSNGLFDAFIAKYDDSGNALWAINPFGTNTNDFGYSIAYDSQGNNYITGIFKGNITFGSTTLTSSGDNDIFIAKYDPSGNVLWARKAGGANHDDSRGIAVDSSGNCYITGSFQGNATFGSTTLINSGFADVFIAKYDMSGNFLWARRAGGAGLTCESYGIAVDGSGNSYITGNFNGSAVFGSTTLTSSGARDVFIAKYDGAGNVLWARRGGDNSDDYGTSIAVDGSGNSFITGYFFSSSTFGSTTLISNGSFDVFIVKYDASGNVVWAKRAGGTSYELGNGIAVDVDGNSYITGGYSGSAVFGSTTLTNSGAYDLFIAKFDTLGNVLWAVKGGGAGDDFAYSIAVDGNSNSYITGYFNVNATFGSTTLTSSGLYDVLIAKIDSTGNFLWAKRAGGANYDLGFGIAVDNSGNSSVTGAFLGNASFGSTILSTPGQEVFVAKLSEISEATIVSGIISPTTYCPGASIDVPFTATGSFNSGNIFTAQLSNSSGSFASPVAIGTLGATTSDTINAAIPVGTAAGSGYRIRVVSSNPAVTGSDNSSDITIYALPTATITPAGSTTFCAGDSVVLNANSGAGLSYEWKKDGISINGATASSYTVKTAGDYIVVVTNANNCTDSSSVETVIINSAPAASITPASSTTFCSGDSVVLNANTGAGLTHQWKKDGNNINGATSSSYTAKVAGSYVVEVSNGGCSATSSPVAVIVNSVTPSASSNSPVLTDGTLQLNSSGGVSYFWTGPNSFSSSDQNPVINNATTAAAGTYTVTVTAANGCTAIANTNVVVNTVTGYDAGVIALVSPAVNGCYGSSQQVIVTIRNYGSARLTSVPVTVEVSGAVATTLSATYSGNLTAGKTTNFVVGTVNMSTSGTYTFNARTELLGDNNLANNALAAQNIAVQAPQSLPVAKVTFTGYDGSNLATAFPGWSEAISAGLPVVQNSSWTLSNSIGSQATAKFNFITKAKNDWILGPKFLVASGAKLYFDAAVTTAAGNAAAVMRPGDGVYVMLSNDCGKNYKSVLAISSKQKLPNALTPFIVDLQSYVGQQVIIGFSAIEGTRNNTTGSSYDFHLDNLFVGTTLPPARMAAPNAVSLAEESLSVKVWPNPFDQDITLQLNTTEKGKVNLTLFDGLGRVVYSESENVNEGESVIPLNLETTLAPGIYYLVVHKNDEIHRLKLIKE